LPYRASLVELTQEEPVLSRDSISNTGVRVGLYLW
jgi:hypothetical protein